MKLIKKLTPLLPGLLLVLFIGACSDGGPSTPTQAESLIPVQGAATEEVCHLAQTKIDVFIENLEEHFAHGDWLIGPEICDGHDNDCDGTVDEEGACDVVNDGSD